MIVDLLLLVLQGALNIILFPLSVVNIAVDFVSSIPIVANFLQVVAYILPWDNLLPLLIVLFAIFFFRIGVSLIKTVWQLIPFL